MEHIKTLNTKNLQTRLRRVDVANVRHPVSLLARLPVQ